MSSVIVAVIATWLILGNRTKQDDAMAYSVAILTTVLISYHLHMQDLAMASLPMLVLAEKALSEWSQRSTPI